MIRFDAVNGDDAWWVPRERISHMRKRTAFGKVEYIVTWVMQNGVQVSEEVTEKSFLAATTPTITITK